VDQADGPKATLKEVPMRTLALAALPTLLLVLPAAGDVVFDSSRRHTTSGGTIWKLTNYFPTSGAETDSTIESPAAPKTRPAPARS
jgi:hypothetical protein